MKKIITRSLATISLSFLMVSMSFTNVHASEVNSISKTNYYTFDQQAEEARLASEINANNIYGNTTGYTKVRMIHQIVAFTL